MHFVPPRIASPRRLAAAVQRAYQIPAGPLSTSLSRFAGEAGISLSVNGSLTDGKTAPALQGSYTPEQGLQHLLAGSGLEALARAPGSYVLRQAMMAAAPAEQSMAVITVVGNWL